MKNIKFPFEIFPTDKKVLKIKEGIYWVKLLLPSMISHVNVYVLDDINGITIIDTGLFCNSCIDHWRNILRNDFNGCLLYTSPSPRDQRGSRMPSSA